MTLFGWCLILLLAGRYEFERAAGYDVEQIANDVGMSRQMVERYMRFRDQMEVGAAGRARLKLVEQNRP
jgi:hypothetical protein